MGQLNRLLEKLLDDKLTSYLQCRRLLLRCGSDLS